MISIHLALPWEGHTKQMYHVFEYLMKYHNSEIVIDPNDQVIYQNNFERQYWTSSEFVHVSGKQDLTLNMPAKRGLGFVIKARVDSYHSVDTVTQRYRTGFLIYVKSVSIYWMSNKQTSCECSSFGSDCFS